MYVLMVVLVVAVCGYCGRVECPEVDLCVCVCLCVRARACGVVGFQVEIYAIEM